MMKKIEIYKLGERLWFIYEYEARVEKILSISINSKGIKYLMNEGRSGLWLDSSRVFETKEDLIKSL